MRGRDASVRGGRGAGRRGRRSGPRRPAVQPASSPVEVEIDALAFGGSGVGRLPAAHPDTAEGGTHLSSEAGEAGGMVVFVRGALPGSRVRVRVTRSHRRYAEAELLEVLRPSPDAVPPACPHFDPAGKGCGGCQLRHLAPARQLFWKERQLVDALARIGRVTPEKVLPAVPAPQATGFRNKMEFAFQGAGEGLRLGLRRGDDPGRVVDLETCLLLPAGGMELLRAVRTGCRGAGLSAFDPRRGGGFLRRLVLRHSVFRNRWLAEVLTAPADPDGRGTRALRTLGAELLRKYPELAGFVQAERGGRDDLAQAQRTLFVLGESALVEDLGGVRCRVGADAFFQTASAGAVALYSALREMAAPAEGETLCDLYCGGGGIALFLAGGCGPVLGVEADPAAVADAEANARLNGLENCRFLRADLAADRPLEELLPQDFGVPDLVTVDPPRAGLSAGVTAWLLRSRPGRVAYVSCNPATFARDAGLLAPGYRLAAVRAVDMFPHTAHVECLALFAAR